MRIRIGTNDNNYRNYGHGRSRMSEFERLFHLIVSLQILFGSRRGLMWVPIVVLILVFGGLFFYNQMYNNPEKLLSEADRKWNTGVETQQMAAITQYMQILNRQDANLLDQLLNPSESSRSDQDMGPLLKDPERRQILYKRIILHQFRYVNEEEAALWIEMALNEGFELEFVEDDVDAFWNKATAKLRGRTSQPAQPPTPSDSARPPGKFDNLPGVDQGAQWAPWQSGLAVCP